MFASVAPARRASYPGCIVRAALCLSALVALLVSAPAAAFPTMAVGAAEDIVRSRSLADSKAQFELAAAAGLEVIRTTALWRPGETAPDGRMLAEYRTTARAAALTGIRLMVQVLPEGNRQVPLDEAARAQFAAFTVALLRELPAVRSVVVGNEPNLNFFWLPQYDPDGASASPAAYVALLATVYDAVKELDPRIEVVGGSLSPAGTDRPFGIRPSHSPGRFIVAMGQAFRASGRASPIMDSFAFHPYGELSKSPPSATHPNSTRIAIADYDKLVGFLAAAFDGTAQPGSTLPIVYDEYGVQTAVPAAKHELYTQHDGAGATDVVDEATQALYYREALTIAFCQPNVKTFLLFHTVDERDLRRWQSGLYYPDLTPKSSLDGARRAIIETRRGVLARCPGVSLPVEPLRIRFPASRRVPRGSLVWRIWAGCVQDCAYDARLLKLPRGSTTLVRRGVLIGGRPTRIALPARRVAPGRYRLTLRLVSLGHPGEPLVRDGRPFRVG